MLKNPSAWFTRETSQPTPVQQHQPSVRCACMKGAPGPTDVHQSQLELLRLGRSEELWFAPGDGWEQCGPHPRGDGALHAGPSRRPGDGRGRHRVLRRSRSAGDWGGGQWEVEISGLRLGQKLHPRVILGRNPPTHGTPFSALLEARI